MKIALINGSPKKNETSRKNRSVSGLILQAVREKLGDLHDYVTCTPAVSEKEQSLSSLKDCDAVIFAFPLYIDGIPSHLLHFLDEIKDDIKTAAPEAMVWAAVNNGFYEGSQNVLALDMMQAFCIASGLKWGQGIGIGAGGMIKAAPVGKGPMRNLGLALDSLAENIICSRPQSNLFTVPNFPRFLYKTFAHFGWRTDAGKNGIKTKDLYDKYEQISQ